MRGTCARLRGESHRDGPAESDAEIELRHVHDALEPGVGDREHGACDGEQLRERVELQREPRGEEAERDEQEERLGRRNAPGRDRAVPGALDFGIDVAVDVVVDDAPGRAHDDDADVKRIRSRGSGLPLPANQSPHSAGHSSSQMPIGLCSRMRSAYSRNVLPSARNAVRSGCGFHSGL